MNKITERLRIIFVLLPAITICVSLAGCSGDMPDEYKPGKPYLIIDNNDINIGTQRFLEVPVKSGSAWTVDISESWMTSRYAYYAGATNLVCDVKTNRTTTPRKCTIVVSSNTASGILTRTVDITQEVDYSPEINLDRSEIPAAGSGGSFSVNVEHNYGVQVTAVYDEGVGPGEEWLHFTPAFTLGDNQLIVEALEISYDANRGAERQAQIVFTSTGSESESEPVSLTVKQLPDVPAITSFNDNFAYVTTTGEDITAAAYAQKGWSIQQTSLKFRGFNNTFKGMLCNAGLADGVPAFAILPPLDVKNSENKKFTFKWGPGNANNNPGGETMELVYSTNYAADAYTATWHVIEDCSFQTGGIGTQRLREISLDVIKEQEYVYIGFRYIGSITAYRLSEINFN